MLPLPDPVPSTFPRTDTESARGFSPTAGAPTCACPTCGQPLPANSELRIDDAGIVVANGCVASLTGQEAAILLDLHRHMPGVRTKEQLLHALEGTGPDDGPEIKIVDVVISKLRRKLTPLGLKIETVWGRGYRFLGSVA